MSENSGNKRERFGRYLLLDHLVDGGMAKICRARYLGEQADKVVALKMVQAKYSNDEAYKKMFMDEIKVTFSLIHPNIVQTYDYGVYEDQLYVAMEYCDGRNLKEYLEKLKNRKFVFPVEISTYITSQICQGLHYAHTYEDKLTGKASKIIHRDISPHNIMLTFDGSVKIIDFGIAKSKVNMEATQAGTIKGKLSYLAPEYLEGLELDARYDLFATGITLWEMLCSRKLFKAKNDLAVLKKIQECRIPAPSSINPNVPKELDQIVLRALSKDREKRYKNMDQFNRELMKFLYSHYPEFNATDLTYFAKELFKEEIANDRERMHEFGKIDIKPYLEDYYNESNRSSSTSSSSSSSDENLKVVGQEFDFDFSEDNVKQSKEEIDKVLERSITRPAHTKQFKSLVKGKASKKASYTRTKTKQEQNKTKLTNTKAQSLNESKSNSTVKTTIIAASVAVFAFFLYSQVRKSRINKEVISDTESQKILEEKQATRRFGILSLKNLDTMEQKVYINGELRKVDLLGELKLQIGNDYNLRVQAKNREDFIQNFSLTNKKPTVEVTVPLMKKAAYGYLVTSRSCVTGKIYYQLYGEQREAKLPISSNEKIPFPLKTQGEGRAPAAVTYSVQYHIDGEEFKRKTEFTINEEADLVDFCDHLNFNN